MEFKHYDAKERAERFKESMKGGFLSRSDISTIIDLDGGIPDYAKEEVKRLALRD